ncbi:DUF1707 and DUF4870 domain-containing protein [Actinomadura rayongensis]|uniref:DUF1707 domain-containing protein n=1 Tax=Actinomadura rayongensis TaxID=1429076 RepID=A0A6I4W768_9ACTN|nr:DUF1707 and DUF4870 domain-containing protein [Actinomadura rayongensis]MXQ66599.1 DUF1707 domain-containing protein [Actinomadura rayongensis]
MDGKHFGGVEDVGRLRVSDAERDAVVGRLQDAYAEGRLDHDEFDLRAHLAMTAKTRGELETVLVDLAVGGEDGARAGALSGEDRVLAALSHALGVPTLFVGPLVLMLTSGKRSAYVRRHAVEAVNFQLTLLLVTVVTFGIGGVLYALTWVVAAVAAVVALTGNGFRTPWILRLVR